MVVTPRRVLHVMNGATGGAALSTLGLMSELERTYGVEPVALCHDAGSPGDRSALRDACRGRVAFAPLYLWHKQIRTPLWKRPLVELKQLARTGATRRSTERAAELAREHGVELVHTNTILTPEGAFAARRLGLGHVWHVREMIGSGAPFRLPIEGPMLGAVLARHASFVVANSEASAARIRGWMPRGLLEVVDNGLDLGRFVPRDPTDRRPKVVAMVANVTSRWKQHRLFIEAAARVDPSHGAVFRFYGHAPPEDDYVRELVELARELGVSLELAGFVDDPARIMGEIDLMVHPAANESFGRIAVEALAAGVPFVGVAAGGIRSIITSEHDGLLAPPGDAGALAAQVNRALASLELRTRLSQNGRLTAATRYSIAGCARRMADIYGRAMRAPLHG